MRPPPGASADQPPSQHCALQFVQLLGSGSGGPWPKNELPWLQARQAPAHPAPLWAQSSPPLARMIPPPALLLPALKHHVPPLAMLPCPF